MAVRCERLTESIAGTASSRIRMTCAARLSSSRGVCRQGSRGFRSGERQPSANCQRRHDGSQYFQIHLSSPLMERTQTQVFEFSRGAIDFDQHRRAKSNAISALHE
jgi:hypothetical protein